MNTKERLIISDKIQNQRAATDRKTDQEQANKRYYYLITAISHYPFLLFFFQNTKLKQKNKLSESK
jgi:hypothetical protein